MAQKPNQLPLTVRESGETRLDRMKVGPEFAEALRSLQPISISKVTERNDILKLHLPPRLGITFQKGDTLTKKLPLLFGNQKTYGTLTDNQRYFIMTLTTILEQNGIEADVIPVGAEIVFNFQQGKFYVDKPEEAKSLQLQEFVEVREKSKTEREVLMKEILQAGGLYDAMDRGGDKGSYEGRVAFMKAHQDEFISIFNEFMQDDAQKLDATKENFGYRRTNNEDQNAAFLKTYIALKTQEFFGTKPEPETAAPIEAPGVAPVPVAPVEPTVTPVEPVVEPAEAMVQPEPVAEPEPAAAPEPTPEPAPEPVVEAQPEAPAAEPVAPVVAEPEAPASAPAAVDVEPDLAEPVATEQVVEVPVEEEMPEPEPAPEPQAVPEPLEAPATPAAPAAPTQTTSQAMDRIEERVNVEQAIEAEIAAEDTVKSGELVRLREEMKGYEERNVQKAISAKFEEMMALGVALEPVDYLRGVKSAQMLGDAALAYRRATAGGVASRLERTEETQELAAIRFDLESKYGSVVIKTKAGKRKRSFERVGGLPMDPKQTAAIEAAAKAIAKEGFYSGYLPQGRYLLNGENTITVRVGNLDETPDSYSF